MDEPVRRRLLLAMACGLSGAFLERLALARTEAEGGAVPRATRSIPDDAPDAWRSVIAAYTRLRTYREELIGILEHRVLGVQIRTSCRARTWFIAPRSFRHEMDVIGQSTRPSSIYLHDGSRSWDYDQEAGWQAVDTVRNLTSGLFGGSIATGGQGYWTLSLLVPEEDLAYPSLRTLSGVTVEGSETLDGKRCMVFSGKYRRRDSLRIWASESSRMILRIDSKYSESESASFRYRAEADLPVGLEDLVRGSPGEGK